MPGLVVFKRRWGTGSDDLVLPCFMLALTHLILFVVISVYLTTSPELNLWSGLSVEQMQELNAAQSDIVKASCASEIKYFSFGYLGLLITAMLLEIVMMAFSMQGTIMDPAPRKPVEYLIYIRIVLGCAELIYTIAVAIKLGQDWVACSILRGIFNVQAGIIGVNGIVLLVVILTACCTFDSAGGAFYKFEQALLDDNSPTHINNIRTELDKEKQLFWRQTFAKCFCCRLRSTNTRAALDEVAQLFGDFFNKQDFVPSDLVAGFVLLRHRQQYREEQVKDSLDNPIKEFMCGRAITDQTTFFDHSNATDRHEFELMTYYCQFAVASYGPLMYMYSHKACGLCYLAKECMCGTYRDSCCPSIQRAQHQRMFAYASVHDDVCCQWRTSAVRKTMLESGLKGEVDLVYISWNNDLFKQPFYVAVDHNQRSVVVTIRGTLSNIDALQDIIATPAQIPAHGVDSSWKAHKGILQGAIHIKQKLLGEEMILSQAFGRDLNRGTRDYSLVIVGHSLGAGVAAILAILLRNRYPNLVCYSYAPPGGLLSLSAMQGSKGYINTVVLGKDLIVRTSLSQMERMRNEITHLLHNTKLPKYKVILGNIVHSTKKMQRILEGETRQEGGDEDEYRMLMESPVSGRSQQEEVLEYEDLFPPGRILHVVYKKQAGDANCSSSARKQFFAIESDNMKDFSEIIISHQMVSHHFPTELLKAMQKVVSHSENADSSRRYTEAETLPVSGITRNGRSRRSDMANKPQDTIIEQPTSGSLQNSEGTRSNPDASQEDIQPTEPDRAPAVDNVIQESDVTAPVPSASVVDDEVFVAPLARMDSYSESGSNYSMDLPMSPTAGPLPSSNSRVIVDVIVEEPEPLSNQSGNNSMQNLSSEPIVEDTDPEPQDTENHDNSLLLRFGDYIDVVLPEPHRWSQEVVGEQTDNKESGATEAVTSRYKRSRSMPGRSASLHNDRGWATVDRDTFSRAKFEPNLIPKPPRSQSTRQATRPVDLPVIRGISSAPTTPQNTPLSETAVV